MKGVRRICRLVSRGRLTPATAEKALGEMVEACGGDIEETARVWSRVFDVATSRQPGRKGTLDHFKVLFLLSGVAWR